MSFEWRQSRKYIEERWLFTIRSRVCESRQTVEGIVLALLWSVCFWRCRTFIVQYPVVYKWTVKVFCFDCTLLFWVTCGYHWFHLNFLLFSSRFSFLWNVEEGYIILIILISLLLEYSCTHIGKELCIVFS